MSNNSSIEPIEATTEQKESERRQAVRDFNELGERPLEEKDGQLEHTTLGSILIYHYSDNSNKELDAQLEYRFQYTLGTLLKCINPKEDTQHFEGNDELRRINAIKVLTSAYPELLKTEPESALAIAQGICQRLSGKKDLGFVDDNSFHSNYKKKRSIQEARALLDFFNLAGNFPNYQTNEIALNTFLTLFDNYPKVDYLSYNSVIEILEHYFDSSIEQKNSELFNVLTNQLLSRTEKYNSSNKKDEKKLAAVTYLYKYLFNQPKYFSAEQKRTLNEKLFKQSIDRVNTERNFNIKGGFLWNLASLVKKDNWSNHPALLNQETNFHLQILDLSIDLQKEKTPQELIEADENRAQSDGIRSLALDIIGDMLEQYVKYSGNSDNNWFEIAKNHDKEFKNALQTYLDILLAEKNESKKNSLLDRLNVILNFKDIENPKHPFHTEGIEFYAKYSNIRAEQLAKESKKAVRRVINNLISSE